MPLPDIIARRASTGRLAARLLLPAAALLMMATACGSEPTGRLVYPAGKATPVPTPAPTPATSSPAKNGGRTASPPAAGTGSTPAGAAAAAPGPQVVRYTGVPGLAFGDTEQDLIRRGVVVRDTPECNPRMVRPTGATPVFVDGRLALLWADPPLHTPEGIAVGDSVASVRKAYPAASDLAPPAGSYRFSGLLAGSGDRAYLFLHDGRQVQKLIVGYTRHARTLFEQGFGGC